LGQLINPGSPKDAGIHLREVLKSCEEIRHGWHIFRLGLLLFRKQALLKLVAKIVDFFLHGSLVSCSLAFQYLDLSKPTTLLLCRSSSVSSGFLGADSFLSVAFFVLALADDFEAL